MFFFSFFFFWPSNRLGQVRIQSTITQLDTFVACNHKDFLLYACFVEYILYV